MVSLKIPSSRPRRGRSWCFWRESEWWRKEQVWFVYRYLKPFHPTRCGTLWWCREKLRKLSKYFPYVATLKTKQLRNIRVSGFIHSPWGISMSPKQSQLPMGGLYWNTVNCIRNIQEDSSNPSHDFTCTMVLTSGTCVRVLYPLPENDYKSKVRIISYRYITQRG